MGHVLLVIFLTHIALEGTSEADLPTAPPPPVVVEGASRPYLYLDGTRLANAITPWILKNTDPNVRRMSTEIYQLKKRLFLGDQVTTHLRLSDELKVWMLSQPDRSILPQRLYEKAIEIAKGNVESGMISVWNVLCANHDGYRTRNRLAHTVKLADITGEHVHFTPGDVLLPRVDPKTGRILMTDSGPIWRRLKTIRGDIFSAWYHFAGTALNSYHRSTKGSGWLSGRLETDILIFGEEHVLFEKHIDGYKRVLLDREGAKFGEALARNVRSFRTPEEFAKDPRATRKEYLYDAPEKYPRNWELRPGQQSIDYLTKRRSLFLANGNADDLLRGLKSKDVIERYFSAVAVVQRTQPDRFELIKEALMDPDPAIRFVVSGQVIRSPSLIDPLSRDIQTVILNLLKSDSGRENQLAYSLIYHLSDPNIPKRHISGLLSQSNFESLLLSAIKASKLSKSKNWRVNAQEMLMWLLAAKNGQTDYRISLNIYDRPYNPSCIRQSLKDLLLKVVKSGLKR